MPTDDIARCITCKAPIGPKPAEGASIMELLSATRQCSQCKFNWPPFATEMNVRRMAGL